MDTEYNRTDVSGIDLRSSNLYTVHIQSRIWNISRSIVLKGITTGESSAMDPEITTTFDILCHFVSWIEACKSDLIRMSIGPLKW
ncbi:hypothetical protein [Methanosarcina mazei]|uniref:hypothetical protein n=1 Tax=Methanosarcina mazei TaxID=2209 RepID=UPI000B042187|nr:hypothetical protein [Methanosarcina mazei]